VKATTAKARDLYSGVLMLARTNAMIFAICLEFAYQSLIFTFAH
jgi:hypothetical protein